MKIKLLYADFKALQATLNEDAIRFFLSGWHIGEVKENVKEDSVDVEFVTTNGHQMSRLLVTAEKELKEIDDKDFSGVESVKIFKELEGKIFEPPEAKANHFLILEKKNKEWTFSLKKEKNGGEPKYYEPLRFIEGKFPNYKQVWPVEKNYLGTTCFNGRFIPGEAIRLEFYKDRNFKIIPAPDHDISSVERKGKLEILFLGIDDGKFQDLTLEFVRLQEHVKGLKAEIEELEKENAKLEKKAAPKKEKKRKKVTA